MEILFGIVGGVGFFLLGMNLLTEGLKNFAGDSLRRGLVYFTGAPWKACLTGTVATLLVQSSSATTIAVIGFVSAGLLSFPQALGVIFGASLGTTGTSWIVAWIGLKIKIGLYALPLVGVGAFARLLGRHQWRELGTSLAGFGLIFIGIDTLQQGMQGVASAFDLAGLPAHGFLGHAVVVLIGIALTVVMQSSSAAVATTLTALAAGAINFEQASSLVIGAAIGTTVTGALAAIGAGVPARRTALAHILFNLTTGLLALLMLPLFLWIVDRADAGGTSADAAISLAAFHTVFIGLGVVLFLPFVARFARLVERLVPEGQRSLTRHLDRTLRSTPAVALAATQSALIETFQQMIRHLRTGLSTGHWPSDAEEISAAIREIQQYLDSLSAHPEDEALTLSRLRQLHAVDHLRRLTGRLTPDKSVRGLLKRDELSVPTTRCLKLLELAANSLGEPTDATWRTQLREQSQQIADLRRDQRPEVIEQTARGGRGPADALHILDTYRWLDRVGYHTWRASHYLGGEGETSASQPSEPMGDL